MSAGKPMYFLWRLIVFHAPGWRSPRMGKIGCYVIRLIGALIDRGITFLGHWSAYMHGGLGFLLMWWPWKTYRMGHNGELGNQGRPDGFDGWEVNQSRIKIELKMRIDSKVKMGCWGPSVSGQEKYGSWQPSLVLFDLPLPGMAAMISNIMPRCFTCGLHWWRSLVSHITTKIRLHFPTGYKLRDIIGTSSFDWIHLDEVEVAQQLHWCIHMH